MYRFLIAPRWLVGHVVVVAVVVLFVNLGFWQLRRLDEVRSHNALLAERIAAPARPLDELLAAAGGDPSAAVFRRAVVAGRYLPDQELLLGPRSLDGRPGWHLLTPLLTDGGRVVLVARGWVPYEFDRPPVRPAAPPDGPVRAHGLVFEGQPPARMGPPIPPEGHVDTVPRVDVARLQAQFTQPLYPVYLQADAPAGPGTLPLALPAPVLDEGNHLSYALQWFAFAGIALIGYAALLSKTAREERDGTHPPGLPGPVPPRTPEVAERP